MGIVPAAVLTTRYTNEGDMGIVPSAVLTNNNNNNNNNEIYNAHISKGMQSSRRRELGGREK